ncbi:hypothetical protein F5146DRAFT_1145280 [Armillaria mellea]|nr:hypothetical protein F5146DRAFT_1145280 [Armillaria mellea]
MENGTDMDVISIVSLALEGILYGLSFLMFSATVYILISRPRRDTESRAIRTAIILTACTFGALTTAVTHTIIDVHHVLSGFVYTNKLVEGDSAAYFSDFIPSPDLSPLGANRSIGGIVSVLEHEIEHWMQVIFVSTLATVRVSDPTLEYELVRGRIDL